MASVALLRWSDGAMEQLIDCRLRFGSSLIISGPSGSGKTQLLIRCLYPDNQEAVFGEKIKENIFHFHNLAACV